jgi:hypothetical protein
MMHLWLDLMLDLWLHLWFILDNYDALMMDL